MAAAKPVNMAKPAPIYFKPSPVSIKKVKIVCPVHGEFETQASNHLMGHGCPHCNESKLETTINNQFGGF